MFKKPVRIKSNNQVKGSERKVVKDMIWKSFPCLGDTELNLLFSNKKEVINCIKLITFNSEILQVYVIQKQPLFFIIREKVFPTVFLLWKCPNLLPSYTTNPQVMKFISSGADLMLPGLVTPPSKSELPKYGSVSEGDLVYINLTSNKAAIAVGVASQSSYEMERAGGKGKCVIVHHFYGDQLCTLDGNNLSQIPQLGPPEWLCFNTYNCDFPELGNSFKNENVSVENKESYLESKEIIAEVTGESDKTSEVLKEVADIEVSMDKLLYDCFLTSIKYSKTLKLPILVSNFFKSEMLPVCPTGITLDIKKSSYKKLKTFLNEMCKIGLISIKEIKKGVESITDINQSHPKFSEFYLKPEDRPKNMDESNNQNQTFVEESYIVTQNVLPFFQSAGFNKGDIIDGISVRKTVTNYVKQNNCLDLDNSKLIKPKTDLLKLVCRTENSISWEELFEKVCDSMKNCFQVSSGGETTLQKGKISPITMNVSIRSGNKKVTMVDNLEIFGININEFAKECQHGVAASTSITHKPPGKKCDQLLIQGNQVLFVHDLLETKYKVPKKYIRGLEHAPKKRK